MREVVRTRSVDEAAVAVFLAGLVGMTPRATAHRAHALAVLVRDAPSHADLPVSPATLTTALRRPRLRLIEEP